VRNHLRLLKYARPHKRSLFVLLLTIGAAVAVDLLKPWPMKILVDNVLGDRPPSDFLRDVGNAMPGPDGDGLLYLAVAGTVGVFLLATTMSMARDLISIALNQRMTYDIGGQMFAHLQRLSLLFHSRRPVGDTISRVTGDSYAASILLTDAVVPAIQSVVMLIAMFAIMLNLHVKLTLLSLAVVPFMFVVIKAFGRPMKDRTRVRRDLEGQMTNVVQQTLTAVPAVQAFTREEREVARYRHYADRTVRAYVRSTATGVWFHLFSGGMTAIGTALIMYYGARLAADGEVTVGTLLVFLAYLTSLYGPLDALAYTTSMVQLAAAQGDRVFEILDSVPDVEDAPDARDLEIRGAGREEAFLQLTGGDAVTDAEELGS